MYWSVTLDSEQEIVIFKGGAEKKWYKQGYS